MSTPVGTISGKFFPPRVHTVDHTPGVGYPVHMGHHTQTDEFTAWLAAVTARVKAIREQKGLSLRAAGELTGVPFNTIARVEAGRTVPSLEVLYTLAAGYGVTPACLLCGDRRRK